MKKILFLLLFTSAMYGQIVPTGQEQDFDYGIKNTASQLDDNAVFITVQNSDGVQGKSTSSVWAKKIYVDNADVKKAFLSTGLIKNGLVQANADPTKFNITAGIGIISNFDDPNNPTSTIVSFPAFTGITPTYLTSGNITYIAINSSAAIVQQATPFTNVQRRDYIILGAVIHSNLTTINLVNNISAPTNAGTNQLHDLMEAIGALNVDGNKITANGANLSINKTAGDIFKLGVNFANDWKNPHKLNLPLQTLATFRYRTQNGTEGANVTVLNPALYDVANVLTAVPSNKFSIQTVTLFQTGAIRVQYGQATYATLSEAESAINTRTYNVEPNIAANGITRAYIILKNTATSLQNASDTKIVEAGKFGNVGGSGGAITLDAIVAALGYTPENVANKSDSYTVSSSTTYASTKAVVDGLATKQNTLTNPITGTGTANTISKWTGTSTQGNSSITDNGSTVAIGIPTTIKGTTATDGGQLGAELLTTGTSDASWTGTSFATGYTHVAGSVTTLTSTLAAVINNYYQITYTVTGRTAGSFTIGFGGYLSGGITATGNIGPRATTTETLVITPTTDFNGTIVLSIKQITSGSATISLLNSLGAVSNEIRAIGNSNTAIGLNALRSNTTGSSNTANGVNALSSNTTGNSNTANGLSALRLNTTGNYNTANGVNALSSNTTGNGNTANGLSALSSNTIGASNTANGEVALSSNTTGNYNTANGSGALYSNTTGSSNTAIGLNALRSNTTGSNNNAIGVDAGRYISNKSTAATILNNSIFLGYRTSPLADNQTNQTVIGYDATGLGSNTTVLGNSSTVQTWLGGRLTIGSTVDDGSSTFQLTGVAKLNTAPTTSAGTYDILTRNSSTGIVEKVLSNTLPNIGNTNLSLNSDRLLNGVLNLGIGTYGLNIENLKHFKMSSFQSGGKRGEFSFFPVGEPTKLFELFANQDANLEGSPFLDGLTTMTRLGYYEFSGNSSSVDVHGNYIKYVSNNHYFQDYANNNMFTVAQDGFISYKTPSINAYFDNTGISSSRYYAMPDASGTIALVETVKPYKVYTALLSQSGTSAPTATVLENTLGGTIVWTRSATGIYVGTLSGAFTVDKTLTLMNTGHNVNGFEGISRVDADSVKVQTYINGPTYSDGRLSNSGASIEIRVYN